MNSEELVVFYYVIESFDLTQSRYAVTVSGEDPSTISHRFQVLGAFFTPLSARSHG